jgi:hypothetical protein
MRVLQVRPEATGWSLHGFGEPQYFRSGCRAERAARRLATALAQTGTEVVELLIADRSGRLAGRIRVTPAEVSVTHELATHALAPA